MINKQQRDRNDPLLRVVGTKFRQEKIAYTINKKERTMLTSMRKILIVTAVAIFTMAVFSPMANATVYHGACGGGSNLNDAIKGWKAHGVLDDVVRMVGQTPRTDGPSAKIAREGLVRVTTTRGVWVTNYTCKGGKFVKLGKKKYLPKGFVLYVPKKEAPAPGKTGKVKHGLQGNCGNKADNIPVKRPGKPKKHKSKPKPPTVPTGSVICSTGFQVDANGNCVQQTNSAEQKCKDSGGTWDSNKNQCTIIQTNANCSNVIVVNGSGNTIYNYQEGNCNDLQQECVNNGGSWNGDTNTCTTNQQPCQQNCEVDHKPQVSCVFPPHMYVGGNQALFCEASDPDGDQVSSPNFVVDAHARVNSTVPVDTRWDNTPCPTGVTCFRSTLWADSVGFANITVTVVAGGMTSDPTKGTVEIKADNGSCDSGFCT